ncbi:MAG: LysM peptidoglycan-binding domain-containing protein [Gemmatimonadota bacterium]
MNRIPRVAGAVVASLVLTLAVQGCDQDGGATIEADSIEETPRSEAMPPPAPDLAPAPSAQTHTVRAGETLGGIARQYYGTPGAWRRIYEANSDVIDNPDAVPVGAELTIPHQENQ